MRSRRPPRFSGQEKRELMDFLREKLSQTTRRIVEAFFEDMNARVDLSPEEAELIRFNILNVLAMTGCSRLSWGLIYSLEYSASDMEFDHDLAVATELQALATIMRERLRAKKRY
jgi:hypothetical protein